MAKKSPTLTFRDIVLGAEADVIRQAHEARVKIDQLIEERQRAYEQIAALENQIEDVIGEPGVYPFPAPALPVAGFDPKADTVIRGATPAKKPVTAGKPGVAGATGASGANASAAEEGDDEEDESPAAVATPAPASTGAAKPVAQGVAAIVRPPMPPSAGGATPPKA